MTSTDPLLSLLSNGNGRFFAKCHWCHMQTKSIDTPDELRVLANVKAEGWHIEAIPSEPYRLTCRMCRPVRGKGVA